MIRSRGRFITVLIGAMAASTFQLFALAVLAVTLIEEFDITRVEIGLLGAGNTMIGALTAPSFGKLTDRIGARRSVIILCSIASIGLVGTAAVPGYWFLLVFSVLSGFPQGWANSATNKLIAERLLPGERGMVTGLKQSGVQFSIFLAGLTLPVGNDLIGWRATLSGYGLICLGVAVLAATTLDDDRTVAANVSAADDRAVAGGAAPPLPGFVYRVALYALFLGLAAGGISRFIPLFATEELGFSEARAGLVVALSGLLGMVARVIWGRLAETRVSPRFGLFVLACGSAGTALLLFFATTLGGGVLWIVAVGMAFFLGAWNVVAMMAVMASVRSDQAGKGTGIVMLFFLSGLTLSAPAVGWSVDRTGDYQLAWGMAVVLALCGMLTTVEVGSARSQVDA